MKKLLLIAILASLSPKAHSQNITDSEKYTYKLSLLDLFTLPIATVEIETLYIYDTIQIEGLYDGVIFSEDYNNDVYTYSYILDKGSTLFEVCNIYRAGLPQGNFVPTLLDDEVMLYTAKHIVKRPYASNYTAWTATFGRDDIATCDATPQKETLQTHLLKNPVDTFSSLENIEVVVYGWKIFRDGAFYVKIRGTAQKLPRPISSNAPVGFALNETYVVRIPYEYLWVIPGLSGSGVYLSEEENTLVGLQSQIFQTEFQIDSTHYQFASIIIEKL